MTEQRMADSHDAARVLMFRKYQQCSSVWVPWPPRSKVDNHSD